MRGIEGEILRENYRGNKKRREEAQKKKQEEKRNKRLNKSNAVQPPEVGTSPVESLPAAE